MIPPSDKITKPAKAAIGLNQLQSADQSGFGGRPAESSRQLDQAHQLLSRLCVYLRLRYRRGGLAHYPNPAPDVVLMDIFLPRMSGIECTVRLKALLPQTQIVILTAMDDQELVFLALEAGADGYLLKRTKPSDLRVGFAGRAGRRSADDEPDCPARDRVIPTEDQNPG